MKRLRSARLHARAPTHRSERAAGLRAGASRASDWPAASMEVVLAKKAVYSWWCTEGLQTSISICNCMAAESASGLIETANRSRLVTRQSPVQVGEVPPEAADEALLAGDHLARERQPSSC